MSARSVTYELEAKLKGGGRGLFSQPSGKLERKSYADRGERLKINLRNLEVADDSLAVVTADGAEIARIPIQRGAGRFDVESRDPNAFVKLKAGQTLEIRIDGALVLTGTLDID